MKTTSILLACLVVAGCSTVQTSNPRSVVVKAANLAQAAELAEQECLKHRRHARMNSRPQPFQYAFDCVE